MKIIVYSYNRAGLVLATKWLPDAIVACCASQEAQYRQYHDNILVVPDELDGNIVKKRNAVLDLADDDVFLVDDDVVGIRRFGGKMLTPEESLYLILQGFTLMDDIGAGYWGVSKTDDPMKVNEFAPFSLTKPFWQAVGIKKDHLRYDSRLLSCEEIDFFLQKIALYRKVFRFNLYNIVVADPPGGIGLGWTRRKEMERSAQAVIATKWGAQMVEYSRKLGGYDVPRIRCPIKGL